MGSGLVFFTITVAVLLAFVTIDNAEGAAFVKYDGIDGESTDTSGPDGHQQWIDLLSYDWDAKSPGAAATGQSRRRGTVIVEDLRLTMEYDKASPKIMEKMLKGEIIPKLEIEQTASFGGTEQVYLKWELCKVIVTEYSFSADDLDSIPTVVVGNNFEEIKVTYTEYNDSGSPVSETVVGYDVVRQIADDDVCGGGSTGPN